MSAPEIPGNNEGDLWWDWGEGCNWVWHFDKTAPVQFAISVSHIATYGAPLLIGLTREEVSSVVGGLLHDPRSDTVTIKKMVLPGKWERVEPPAAAGQTGESVAP